MQGEGAAGLAQLRQGLAHIVAMGQELSRPFCLVLLAEVAGHVGQVEDGLRLLAETMTVLEASGRGTYWRRRIASMAHCCCIKPFPMWCRRKPVSSRPWPSPAASGLRLGSCGPPSA
jgi:hypothetical protein